ncbi:MAG: hypothetical protein ABI434_13045 [Burkholderiaceae bacterium]
MATKMPAVKSAAAKQKAAANESPKSKKAGTPSKPGREKPRLGVKLEGKILGYSDLKKRKLNLAVFLDMQKLSPDHWDALEKILLEVRVAPVVIAQSCSVPPPVTIPKIRRTSKK